MLDPLAPQSTSNWRARLFFYEWKLVANEDNRKIGSNKRDKKLYRRQACDCRNTVSSRGQVTKCPVGRSSWLLWVAAKASLLYVALLVTAGGITGCQSMAPSNNGCTLLGVSAWRARRHLCLQRWMFVASFRSCEGQRSRLSITRRWNTTKNAKSFVRCTSYGSSRKLSSKDCVTRIAWRVKRNICVRGYIRCENWINTNWILYTRD